MASWVAAVALFGLFLVLWRRRPFRVEVRGESMEPTLRAGDYLIAIRSERPRRGALVVVKHPARPRLDLVKRVTGVPGDHVDGHRLSDREHWVVGDNPAASTDSRTLGPIPDGMVRGIVVLRYWPRSRISWLR
ncbi:MAG TPA: signal peptidase I [Actinomycetota bacterium]